MNEQQLSESIEELLVSRNLRHMSVAQAALQPGYYLRGARHLRDITGTVIIGTGEQRALCTHNAPHRTQGP